MSQTVCSPIQSPIQCVAFQKQLCPVLSGGSCLIFLTCKVTFARPNPLAAEVASDQTAQHTETLKQESTTEKAEGMLLITLTHALRLTGLRQSVRAAKLLARIALLRIAIATAAVRAPAFQTGYQGCALPGRCGVSYHSVPALLISSHQHSVGSPRLWAAGMQAQFHSLSEPSFLLKTLLMATITCPCGHWKLKPCRYTLTHSSLSPQLQGPQQQSPYWPHATVTRGRNTQRRTRSILRMFLAQKCPTGLLGWPFYIASNIWLPDVMLPDPSAMCHCLAKLL